MLYSYHLLEGISHWGQRYFPITAVFRLAQERNFYQIKLICFKLSSWNTMQYISNKFLG